MKNINNNNSNNNTNNNVKFHFRGPERYYAVAGRQLDEATNDGTDNYLTPQSSPLKTTIITLLVLTILACIIIIPIARGTFVTKPAKLKNNYTPAVFDEAGIIDDEDALLKTLDEYHKLTGICPVIYTVNDSAWKPQKNLKEYALYRYDRDFKDQDHLAIVFSVNQVSSEKTTYKVAAIQGQNTVNIITIYTILHFKNMLNSGISKGLSINENLDNAFKYAIKDAQGKLNPTTADNLKNGFLEALPLIIVSLAFIIIFIVVIRKFIKERNAWKEDVRKDPRLA